jgi:protein gp37
MSITKIEWAEQTWNPIAGCSLKSPGCKGCYAMSMASRLEAIELAYQAKHGKAGPHAHYIGLTQKVKGTPVWTGKIGIAGDAIFLAPLRRKKPTDYFVNSMADLFHPDVPDDVIDRVFAIMALCPQHSFKILTKRADRMRAYIQSRISLAGNIGGHAVAITLEHNKHVFGGVTTTYPAKAEEVRDVVIDRVHNILPNVMLGVSVEDQARADERIPDLLATPAAKRFLSCEPLLGAVYLLEGPRPSPSEKHIAPLTGWRGRDNQGNDLPHGPKIDLVIVGAESGSKARHMENEWAQSLVDQCKAAGVAAFLKQLSGPKGRPIKDINQFPKGLQIREWPQ